MICQCNISMEAFSKHLSGTVLDRSYPAIPWQGQQLANNVFSQVRPFNSITLTIVSATLSSSCDLSRILNKMQTIFRAWLFKSCSLTHSFPFFEFAGSSQVQPDFHFHFSAPRVHANSVESSGGNQTTVLSGQKTQSVPFQLSTATNYFLQSISPNPPPQATPALRFFLLVANSMAGQNSVYTWSRDHRFIFFLQFLVEILVVLFLSWRI